MSAMKPGYEIRIDPARGLLRITVSGFFDQATLDRFIVERRAAVARLGCAPNQHVVLCDASQSNLSTPDLVGEFGKMANDPRYRGRKLAIVTTSALARLQSRRIAPRQDVGLFDDVALAEAWLMEDAATELAA